MSVFERPVMVTGAAGCIGAWVIADLLGRGVEPVAVDLRDDRRRLTLLLEAERAAAIDWHEADVSDAAALTDIARRREVGAIIHLAALQIPFCRADPVGGAQANVTGTVAVLETARQCSIRNVAIASSVAAYEQHRNPTTLYGVYKLATEGVAALYWKDWRVPSVCIRPHTVYGPGRDQGLTSDPTKAMLAAAAGVPFALAFRGPLQMQYAGEVAGAFVAAAERCPPGALSSHLRGSVTTVEAVVEIVRRLVPDAALSIEGDPLPFPAEFDETALEASIGTWPKTPLERGIESSVRAFRDLLARGLVEAPR